MGIDLDKFIQEFKPKICSFAYNLANGNPVVCQMGFVTYSDKIILHTNTWTKKWNNISDGLSVALCMGFNHLQNYVQIQGIVKKLSTSDAEFSDLERIYFQEHTDAVLYKRNNQEGIILITPQNLRYAKVNGHDVKFEEYTFT